MAGPQRNGSDLSFAGFVLLALLGTFVWKNVPLESSRPEGSHKTWDKGAGENLLPAKLWQDPFEPLLHFTSTRLRYKNQGKDKVDTCNIETLKNSAPNGTTNIRVLVPMLTMGQEAERVERRRRRRFAVISGLAEAGFIPSTPDYIGNCILEKPLAGRFGKEQIPVPFEWYQVDNIASPDRKGEATLVLWLNESLFAKRPLGKFRDIAEKIAGNCEGDPEHCDRNISIFVLGPARSGTLAKLASRILKEDKERIKADFNDFRISGFHIFSPTATMANSELFAGASEKTIREMEAAFAPANCQNIKAATDKNEACVSFLRTIQTDDALANLLVKELTDRKDWSPQLDHIALISEWDTSFGRALPRSFTDELCRSLKDTGNCDKIIRYSYLRGIDGRLPDKGHSVKNSGRAGETKQPGNSLLNQNDISIRRPVGTGQFDYLRRIAGNIQDKDKELRASHEGRIRAIGIFGSDVYDKLLILRALKPQFPNALFFTTDLDSQLLHPSEFQWTRNLIVASSFGLELRNDLQGRIPPFRDSYQTSIFFSTMLATRYDFTECPAVDMMGKSSFCPNTGTNQALLKQVPPLLFEIGRYSAVRLGDLQGGSGPSDTVHPKLPGSSDLQTLLLFLLLPTLLILVLHQLKPLAGWPVISLLLALLPLLILVYVALRSHLTGEPLIFNEGVSVWPTQFTRYVAFCLSLYFIHRLFTDLSANCARINRDYFGRKDDVFKLKDHGKTLTEIRASTLETIKSTGARLRNRDRYKCKLPRWLALYPIVIVIVAIGMILTQYNYIKSPWYIPAYWILVLSSWYYLLYKGSIFKVFSGFKGINGWVKDTRNQAISSKNVDAWDYWNSYCELGFPRYRALRSLTLLLLFMSFAALIFSLTGFPISPTRGPASFYVDKIMVITSVPVMLILIFMVLDEFRMCIYWIQGLRRYQFDWGKIDVKKKTLRMGTFETGPDMEWVKIQLIAERTSEIGQLIYYPYLVIIIMLLSRNNYFDNWGMPPGLAIVISINVLLLFLTAMKLRREAENCRRSAINNLNMALLDEFAPNNNENKEEKENYRNRIEKLLEDVQAIREGAFLPIREQPLIRASLPLLGAIGLTFGQYALLFK